jgi:hypothetical protein
MQTQYRRLVSSTKAGLFDGWNTLTGQLSVRFRSQERATSCMSTKRAVTHTDMCGFARLWRNGIKNVALLRRLLIQRSAVQPLHSALHD